MSSIDAATPQEWDNARKSMYGEYAGPDAAFKPREVNPFMNDDDPVNKPPHYQGKYECIDVIEDRLNITAYQGYLEGNVWKYLYRYRNKNGVTDLRKAQWYLERLIGSAV